MNRIKTDLYWGEAVFNRFAGGIVPIAGTSEISKVDDSVVLGREFGFSGVDELCRTNLTSEDRAEVIEVFEKIFAEACCAFDFVGEEFSGAFFNKIDFLLGLVSVKEQGVGARGRGKSAFEKFEDDEIFKKSPAQRMRFELFGRFDAEQPASQSGIAHVEFGALNDGFPDVAEKRGQANNDVRSFKNGCPRLNGLDTDSEGFRECARIEFTAGRRSAESNKIAKRTQISNFLHLANIPLNIGFVVVGENIIGACVRLPNRRKTASKNQFVNIGICRKFGELRKRERKQLGNCDASRERLRNVFHEQKVTASGENKFAGTVFVHKHLRGGKKLGNALRLVDNCAVVPERTQKCRRIVFCRSARHRQLQIGVSVVWKNVFTQRRFPRLTRSRDTQNRELRLESRKFRRQNACDKGLVAHGKNKANSGSFLNDNL